jgi:hypothetical protein
MDVVVSNDPFDLTIRFSDRDESLYLINRKLGELR